MKIKQRKLTEIGLYESNPRLNDDAVEAVAASIREFGFRQPIVVDTDGGRKGGRYRYGDLGSFLGISLHVPADREKVFVILDGK